MVELRKIFFKSKESEEAFAKVGLTYENSAWDNDYEAFVRTTKTSEKDAKAEIQNLLRLVFPTGEQYIDYDLGEIKYDSLGELQNIFPAQISVYFT